MAKNVYSKDVLKVFKQERDGSHEAMHSQRRRLGQFMLHALDGSFRGHGKIMIRSNDTDVVILSIPIIIAKVLP